MGFARPMLPRLSTVTAYSFAGTGNAAVLQIFAVPISFRE